MQYESLCSCGVKLRAQGCHPVLKSPTELGLCLLTQWELRTQFGDTPNFAKFTLFKQLARLDTFLYCIINNSKYI